MRRAIACLTPLALILASCGSDESAEQADATAVEGMTGEEIAAEMAGAVRPLPGQYSSTVELVELEMPGVPKAQVDQLKGMMGKAMAQASSYCLTIEDAEKGFEEMARQSQENCKVESFDVDGAKFGGAMRCDAQGATGTMMLDGTGSETGSDITMAMEMQSSDLPGGKMKMTLHAVSKRTGDCKA